MNIGNSFTIAQKDWREVRQNKSVFIPILIVPLIFIVIFPLLITLILPNVAGAVEGFATDPDMQVFFASMPAEMKRVLDGLDAAQIVIVTVLGYIFAPMFLMVPLMFSSTIAAESFAGEKERKTMEALLYLPISDLELFLGKVMAAGIPAVLITWVCFFLYTIIVNGVPYASFGRLWFPLPVWWLLIFWVSPALIAMSISLTVLISTKAQTFQGAYQTSSSIVLIVVVFFIGQMTGVLFLSPLVALIMGFVFWGIAAIIGRVGVKSFNRQKLLTD
ncbi:MAG TPA: ABC transporter permease subunit [Anaerolineaceae bacterium]|nr:ABC transporter permease subunit [Anaerolineaceae bacterium]